VYTNLAAGVAKTGFIQSLKIHWSSLDLMARFLDAFMSEITSIESVVLVDVCKKSVKHVTADTWATLQNACDNMTKTKSFAFLNAKVAAIVYFVLQHLPTTIEDLNFTGCKLNMMCASELSYKLQHAKSLSTLDISSTQLAGSEFVAVLQGLKLCPTIKHLKLCGAKLDRPGVKTLSECLRLTRTLQILDLSKCELGTDMCKILADAIAENRSLQKLVLKNTNVTLEGKSVISHTKLEQLKVVGLEEATRVVFAA
jgi:Leucine-rich repeat (LRR) protein